MDIRLPAVSGLWYPANPAELQAMLTKLLSTTTDLAIKPPKAIIAPHAGYIYSGSIAATIYKTLIPQRDIIKRVVLLGPAHRVGFNGIAVTKANYFATPLGNIKIDAAGIEETLTVPQVQVFEHAYDMEHSLEAQLPFLQMVLGNFQLVPCVVGLAHPKDVAALLLKLWGGAETLIVISSDLSHYYDYHYAQILDQATTEAILKLEPDQIQDNQACGRLPVKGLLLAARSLGLEAKVLDLRNSGDTAGDKNRVVGYGAYHFI